MAVNVGFQEVAWAAKRETRHKGGVVSVIPCDWEETGDEPGARPIKVPSTCQLPLHAHQ